MKAICPVWEGYKTQIEEILVLNLRDRPDRYHAVRGALHAAGAPQNRIKRWGAIPASDYGNIETLVGEAVKDGFPEFETLFEGKNPGRLPKIGQFWSYCQMLRYIVERNITAVILYDDRYITNWSQLAGTYMCMRNIEQYPNNDFKILQLEYYYDFTHKIVNIYTNPDKYAKPYPMMPFVLQGPLGGSENAMLYRPEGAKFFLEKLLTRFHDSVETTLVRLMELPIEERRCIWTYNGPIVDTIHMGSNMYNPDTDVDQTDEITVEERV